jgi:1-acyl-sn-glycerol-3-phosphate acyltransferase
MIDFTVKTLLPLKERIQLSIQRSFSFLGMLITFPFAWIYFVVYSRYRVRHLKPIRKEFKAMSQQCTGPMLICSNHLTFIDSIILLSVFGSIWNYIFRFKAFAWNFSKQSHLKNNLFFRIVCYLSKCVVIDSSASSHIPIKKAAYLLSRGEYLMIFPEGKRSKTGRVDTEDFMYGVGQLLRNAPTSRVLCVYLRGSSQTKSSKFPAKGDTFSCSLKLIHPQTIYQGLRADRDLATQIIQTLSHMEHEYFSRNA